MALALPGAMDPRAHYTGFSPGFKLLYNGSIMEKIKCFMIEATEIMHSEKRYWTDDNGERHTTTSTGPMWRRTDTGEIQPDIGDFPVGAMWYAPWLDELYQPTLDHVLCVRTPGGDWVIDSQCSNCTQPTATYREDGHTIQPKMQTDHHCWCIHGTPPAITVDKSCTTCAAGAGSIQAGTWHGFLTDGYLQLNR